MTVAILERELFLEYREQLQGRVRIMDSVEDVTVQGGDEEREAVTRNRQS